MMLPALVDEEKAVAAVSQWVALVEDKMTAHASRAWLETTLRELLLRDELINRLKVIEAADAGDEIADAALGHVFHSMMDRGETPPASMIAYEARARLRGPVKRSAGRNQYDNWRRDIGIACLVYMTAERFGLRPTRNREQRRRGQPSASSVVAAALGRVHINVAEKRVENIWAGLAGQIFAYWAAQKESPSILQI